MKHKITFNNGFITAITLFLEHKDNWQRIIIDKPDAGEIMKKVLLSDLRLYGATDHLYDMEIPEILSIKLRSKIISWRSKCFHYRMEDFKDTIRTDKLFKEAENILVKIDEEIFKTKKVVMRYR